jgi:hypothetical protein
VCWRAAARLNVAGSGASANTTCGKRPVRDSLDRACVPACRVCVWMVVWVGVGGKRSRTDCSVKTRLAEHRAAVGGAWGCPGTSSSLFMRPCETDAEPHATCAPRVHSSRVPSATREQIAQLVRMSQQRRSMPRQQQPVLQKQPLRPPLVAIRTTRT